jgi:hypothetical protein
MASQTSMKLALSTVARIAGAGLACAVLLAGGALAGCSVSTADGSDESSAADALGGECDRSKYNCKLPAEPKDRNRIFNYATNSYDWPIAKGTPMLDGLGNGRGNVNESSVRVNFGGRRHFSGVSHVYAFAVKLDTKITASGWVKESALKHAPITRMPTVALKDPGEGDYQTIWTVTGGNNAAYEGLKVVKDWSDGGCNATDYLVRPGGFFNLLYNLPGSGGVATDTFPINLPFRRSKGVPELDINLYEPGGTKVVDKMAFIYGHVGDRYGWVARAAISATSGAGQCYVRCCDGSLQGPLEVSSAADCHEDSKSVCDARGHVKRSEFNGVEVYERQEACEPVNPAPSDEPGAGEPPPPPAEQTTGQCYVRCCDGSLQGPIATVDAPTCHDASQGACDAHGHVKRSEFNGAEVWARSNACWAKCWNRDAYHEVVGVTQDCTVHAKEYCAISDRGGLQDAIWSQCQP